MMVVKINEFSSKLKKWKK